VGTSRGDAWFGWLAFGLCLTAGVFWSLFAGEQFIAPPGRQGDDVFYENIGWQLSQGRGLRVDFSDRDWQQAYRRVNLEGQYDWVLNFKQRGDSAAWSPGLPCLVAGVYLLSDRDFLLVRLAVMVLMAAACGWLLFEVSRRVGRLAAALGLATLVLDRFIWQTSGEFMPEGPTAAAATALCGGAWLLGSAVRPNTTPARAGSLAAGILFGLASLLGASWGVWLVIIAGGMVGSVAWRMLSGHWARDRNSTGIAKLMLAFLLGGLLVAAPSWARNCLVTAGFAPFGTGGSMGIVGGYCDGALANFGNLDVSAVRRLKEQALAEVDVRGMSLGQQEYLIGIQSLAAAREWATSNWTKLPQLFGMRIVSHLGFYGQPIALQVVNGLILFGAGLGCWSLRRSLGFWVGLLALLSLATAALTWTQYGRCSIPLRPLLHVTCGVGTVYFWSGILRRLGFGAISR